MTSTVGVVITTYNHAHFLDEALASVFSQRRARRRDRRGRRLVRRSGGGRARFPGVRLIRQQNRGLAAARNAGLAAVDTSIVVFLDADDRLEPAPSKRGSGASLVRRRAASSMGGIAISIGDGGRSASDSSRRASRPIRSCCAATSSPCTGR